MHLNLEDCKLIKIKYVQILGNNFETIQIKQFPDESLYIHCQMLSQKQQCQRQWRQMTILGPVYQISANFASENPQTYQKHILVSH